MNYCLAKLRFKTAIHSGNGILSESNNVFYADTVFSALCNEALISGGEEFLNNFIKTVQDDKIKFSDLLPYIEDELYFPKPVIRIESKETNSSKKAFKKLKYIPVSVFKEFINGEKNEEDAEYEMENFKELGRSEVKISVSIKGEEESKPFAVGSYKFNSNSGLYLIIEYESEKDLNDFKKIFESLSKNGIGGKRSAGLGKFDVDFISEIPEELEEFLNNDSETLMNLSCGMCEDDEIENVLDGATYLLLKRSGFIYSSNFSSTFQKKNDFYVFQSGSCFKNKFNGIIKDVSDGKGSHPVYRYAKPVFAGVRK